MEVVVKIVKWCHHDPLSCSAIIRDGKVPTDKEQSRVILEFENHLFLKSIKHFT